MSNEVRDTLGKFAPKSELSRKVRSVNLIDDAWQWLATVPEKAGVSRNDYLEALAAEDSNPFMETDILGLARLWKRKLPGQAPNGRSQTLQAFAQEMWHSGANSLSEPYCLKSHIF